ncbi:hypothetical protein BJ165DRAFT_1524744 [Panaeolus papilionaceus]|nr:hypothetical protein BJ165DRAFT_1524744 [Panaeolus papilionaceus]
MDVDKSLDEIIKSKPRNPRRGSTRRTSARAQVLGKAQPTPAQKARVSAAPTEAKSEKIIVSNLPADVNESQIRELFTTTVGPLRELNLHYDSAGRSKGVATVLFSRKGDGTKAFQTYNNRLIDGS